MIAIVLCSFGDKLFVRGESECDSIVSKVDNVLDWLPYVELAFQYGLPAVHQSMNEYIDELLDNCCQNPNCAVTMDVFYYVNKFLDMYRHHLEKCKAREFIKTIAVKLVSKYGLHFIPKTVLVSNLGDIVSANPLSLPADVLQFALELAGYKVEGKLVGVTLTTLGGVYGGFLTGGPLGAVIGGTAHLAIWGAREYSMLNYLDWVDRGVEYIVTMK